MKRWLVEHGAGLALGVRGLVAKEMRSRSRGWRPMWLLTFYLAALTVVVAGFPALLGGIGGTISPTMGTQIFAVLAIGSVLLLAFITPALTVGAVSGERERRTLDLLLITRTSALGLVSGKLLGSLVYVLYLLVASLPAFALVYLFGGVPLFHLGMVLAVAAVTAVTHAALGLLLSALLRRTSLASVVAYLLVLFLVFGLPFVAVASSVANPAVPMAKVPTDTSQANLPPVYLYASPLVSVASVLPLPGGPYGIPLIGSLLAVGSVARYSSSYAYSSYAYSSAITSQSVGMMQTIIYTGSNPLTGEPQTLTTWAPWVYHFAFSAVLAILCLLGAALATAPIKPWQAWRIRRRAVPAAGEVRTA